MLARSLEELLEAYDFFSAKVKGWPPDLLRGWLTWAFESDGLLLFRSDTGVLAAVVVFATVHEVGDLDLNPLPFDEGGSVAYIVEAQRDRRIRLASNGMPFPMVLAKAILASRPLVDTIAFRRRRSGRLHAWRVPR